MRSSVAPAFMANTAAAAGNYQLAFSQAGSNTSAVPGQGDVRYVAPAAANRRRTAVPHAHRSNGRRLMSAPGASMDAQRHSYGMYPGYAGAYAPTIA
jgi:hypothetical protein